MRRPTPTAVAAAVVLAAAGLACGSEADTADEPVATAAETATTATAASTIGASDLLINGTADAWDQLTDDDKLVLADRYLAVVGRPGGLASDQVRDATDQYVDTVGVDAVEGTPMRDMIDAAVSIAGLDTAVGESPDEPDPEPAVEPEPDGTYDWRCDYVLGDFTESASGYRFVADATLHNTGNIGTVSRVTAIWEQIGTDAVKQTKTVNVRAGKSRKVQFTIVATQNQIDLHQSADSGCRVRARIVDTFGEAR